MAAPQQDCRRDPQCLEESFQLLSIVAVVFSSLCAVFGMYFLLFILAMWTTYRQSSQVSRKLRMVTVALFLVLAAHFVFRAITFAQRRHLLHQVDDWQAMWSSPAILFITSMTATMAGLISDSLLAWRMYVIWGRARWAWILLVIAIVGNASLGIYGDCQHLTAYRSVKDYVDRFEKMAFQANAAWGWTMLGTHTAMTASIIGRVIYVSRRAGRKGPRPAYECGVLTSIVESALVTWIGLLLYGVASLAPHGHVTTDLDVGFVIGCIVPVFFGISQCLITVRLGLLTRPDSLRSSASVSKLPKSMAANGILVDVQRITRFDDGEESTGGKTPSDLTTV